MSIYDETLNHPHERRLIAALRAAEAERDREEERHNRCSTSRYQKSMMEKVDRAADAKSALEYFRRDNTKNVYTVWTGRLDNGGFYVALHGLEDYPNGLTLTTGDREADQEAIAAHVRRQAEAAQWRRVTEDEAGEWTRAAIDAHDWSHQ